MNNNINISPNNKENLFKKKTPSITLSAGDQELIKNRVFEDLKKEITTDRSSVLTIFGIFASIITFLSVQVQILQKATSFDQLAFLSVLLLFGLVSFTALLQYVTKTWIENNSEKAFYPVYVVILILATLLVVFGIRSTNVKKDYTQPVVINI